MKRSTSATSRRRKRRKEDVEDDSDDGRRPSAYGRLASALLASTPAAKKRRLEAEAGGVHVIGVTASDSDEDGDEQLYGAESDVDEEEKGDVSGDGDLEGDSEDGELDSDQDGYAVDGDGEEDESEQEEEEPEDLVEEAEELEFDDDDDEADGDDADGDSASKDSKEDDMEMEESDDPFVQRYFQRKLSVKEVEAARSGNLRFKLVKPAVEAVEIATSGCDALPAAESLAELHLREQIEKTAAERLPKLSPLQAWLSPYLFSYRDVLLSGRSFDTAPQLRRLFVLHVLSHVLKGRRRIVRHNTRIRLCKRKKMAVPEYPDQGFTRPKVLVLLPFRHSALCWVQMLLELLPKRTVQVTNKKRFFEEYSESEEEKEAAAAVRSFKSKRWLKQFAGNIDDCFRIGISCGRKSVKLYAPFYNADIIIASPLGLRLITGAEGDDSRKFDFLSSIEMVIVDEAETLSMQNWQHVKDVLDVVNQQPKEMHDTDFARVRPWALDGHSDVYRQTVICGAQLTPDTIALMRSMSHNPDGCVRMRPHHNGLLHVIGPQVRQIWQRFDCSDPVEQAEQRFNYFVNEIYPAIKRHMEARTLLFIPDYFDYVRIRNMMQEDEASFCVCCEYTTMPDVSAARKYFFDGDAEVMLVTERFQFFRRYTLRGARHVLFYQPPQAEDMYVDMLNMLSEASREGEAVSARVLFSPLDALRLRRIVGKKRAKRMLRSEKEAFMFM